MTWAIVPAGAEAPLATGSALLWVQVLALWAIAQYGLWSDPSSAQEIEWLKRDGRFRRWRRGVWLRSILLALAVLLLPGMHLEAMGWRVLLAMISGIAGVVLPFGRRRLAEGGAGGDQVSGRAKTRGMWLAEWEIGFASAFAAVTALLVFGAGLDIQRPVVRLPLPPARLACLLALVALWMFLGRGAGYVVRGILNKAGTFPVRKAPAVDTQDPAPTTEPATSSLPESPSGPETMRPAPGSPPVVAPDADGLDSGEYNRGRMIGVVERLLLVLFMSVQGYQAIGLLVAAKGLIRAKELEDRDFAEYFLIGTLSSTLLAIGVGVLVQRILAWFW